MNAQRSCPTLLARFSLLAAVHLLLGAFALHGQDFRPNRPPLPEVALARPVNGSAAITALAGQLPAVAAHYGLTGDRLVFLLRRDHDLWVDPRGRLFFAESYLPDPALAPADSGNAAGATALVPLSDTFRLHSRPSTSKKIYLDFDGHTTVNKSWTDYTDGDQTFVTPPYDFDGAPNTFSDAELERIQFIWQRVVEDYAPFDVDVTTEDPGEDGLRKTTSADLAYGIRVCIGGASQDWYSTSGYGGVAYIGSFDWNSDTPCYVWENNLGNGNEKYVAEAISHEIGHTIDLYHDGTSTTGYYSGHGSGADGWAPIMGVGYYQPVVQFSKGEYTDANNTEDDLAKITASYNIPYLADDHGNSLAAATAIAGPSLVADGIIERNTDVDYFRFEAGAGTFSISILVDNRSPNLNVEATLYDAAGNVVSVSSPADSLGASFSLPGMAAGTYYLKIDGVGSGTSPSTGYSDYGSLGIYTVTGTIPNPGLPVAVASATPNPAVAGSPVQFSSAGSSDPDGTIVAYAWNFGDGQTSSEANPSHLYPASGLYSATLVVTDNSGMTGTDQVTVTVNGPPAAPSNLVATPTCNSNPNYAAISLAWQDNASNETLFRIQWAYVGGTFGVAPGGGEFTSLASPVTHSQLPFATTILYQVRAENSYGPSDWSPVATAATHAVPVGPPLLSASATSGTQVSLTWNAVANATGYRIERSENLSTWTVITTLTSGSTTSYTDSGRTAGATYHYRISAGGPCGYYTAPSSTATVTMPTPPAAPTGLTAAAVSSTQINLAWTDNATGETGYYVERATKSSGPWTRIATLGADAKTYSATGLKAGTSYYFRVQAYGAGVTSAYSNVATAKTLRR